MSLSPSAINSMLGSHSNVYKQTLPFTPAPKVIRKHYSDHQPYHDQHESYHDHHEEHHYSKKKSRSIALTALTLLAFLFFLHILQQCLHDQVEMATTTTAATIVMQANIQAKEGAQHLANVAQDRVGESLYEDPEVTTPFGYDSEERKMSTKGVSERGTVYQYEKVHIPVKMKVIEKNRFKNI